jgi:hypothetical protein
MIILSETMTLIKEEFKINNGAGRGDRTPDGFLRWITDPVQYRFAMPANRISH